MSKKQGLEAKHVLFFCLLSYLFMAGLTYLNDLYPGGVDTANHLFQTWFIKENGLEAWNPYWYGGSPLMDQYPPLTHVFSAALAEFLGVINGYKLASALGFLLLPLSMWFFLGEYKLSDYEKKFAIIFFSFSVIFLHYFEEGVYSAVFSFNFVILYFLYLKRVIDSGGLKNTLLAGMFLSLTALSHALNPVYCVLFSVPFIYAYGRNKFKELLHILVLTLLLCAWFWIPYFVNYKTPSSGIQAINPLTFVAELGRAFVVSLNYAGIFFMAAMILAALYILYMNLSKKRDKEHTLFMILLMLFLFFLRLVPVLGVQETKRAIFFIPLFLSIFLARGISRFKHRNAISAILIIPLALVFFTYPPVNVDTNGEISGAMSYLAGSSAQKVLFLPERFDLTIENKSYYPVAEDTYASFMVPYTTGKSVANGLWSVGAISVDKPTDYWRMTGIDCQRTKSYSELLKDASWLNKNTLGAREPCTVKINDTRYCELLRASSVDTVYVNKFFPEVDNFIAGLECVQKINDIDGFAVYEVKDAKPYISFNDPTVNHGYLRHLGMIEVDYSKIGPGDVRVDIGESFVKQWTAKLDGKAVPIERTIYGTMSISLGSGEGAHRLVLEYEPQRFGGLFTYLSLLSWTALFAALLLLKSKKGNK